MKYMVMAVCTMFLLLAAGGVFGEERFGIQVYPGAKSDASTKKKCDFVDRSGKSAQCFRTSDDFGKVLAFYQKQANLELPQMVKDMPPEMRKNLVQGPKKSFDFCKKGSSDMCGLGQLPAVRINSPWTMNPNISPAAKPDKYEHKDVLIMITSY